MMITPEKFMQDIHVGVNWGGHLKLRWTSPDKRFIIYTVPGHLSWAGIGCGRYYYPAHHHLADLKLAEQVGFSLYQETSVLEIEGRLKRADLEKMIRKAKSLGRASK